ncbi:MAG: phosphoadenylyl-sulfate reductase [Candidatus Dormibacteraeota bacterium]|uniref:Adenosine 5'-phosphosulfate reductase n=1 Tax=Candidatus Aeolococcus gillhamiae TaxID=3127015 RepID=A0A2W6A9Q9_9BACT|nr:phosphoadenylyl-sulfate reductase [Candidatus Dormibacteraeota bacterium]PZR82058.1 MAG: phosphoadenylyl-sulfate reductase [Candidatus Dormibacter sp. RRmetagenome_bin12]
MRAGREELLLERARLDTASPNDVIEWAFSRFPSDRRVVVTGLQADGVAVADMAIAADPSVRVLTIDTGRLPEATHRYLDALRAHWGRGIEVVLPESAEVESFVGGHGSNPFRRSVALRLDCCRIRKVAPLERVLAGVDCWMTGLRRGQSERRATTSVIDIDERHGGVVKVNPVATWREDAVTEYLTQRSVPLHPLYDAGYRSIGCAPCTRAVAPMRTPARAAGGGRTESTRSVGCT